ncbi:hypothetical protein QUB80_07695 [Chlorogloeopsis sp. ULAP01]|uniref:hypothetical protein n=1 Tax=Chlorogloeopsis sp. ULAP01 TaxID=3056483 RepID=UPI0025AA55FD|nr:hypothetical protein [Chlorogloeopsis sp. ULAP01]MDM9380587.1 hypothetical protein [Chlorogloeopsis sp. ULAP01]
MNKVNQKAKRSLSIVLTTTCGVASLLTAIFNTTYSAFASEFIATKSLAAKNDIIANAYTCPQYAGGGKLDAYIETPNFNIYICKKLGKLFYIGTSKRSGKGTRPLLTYVEEGTGYVAKNGNYEYVVNGAVLEILKNGKVVQTDPVIKYISGYTN